MLLFLLLLALSSATKFPVRASLTNEQSQEHDFILHTYLTRDIGCEIPEKLFRFIKSCLSREGSDMTPWKGRQRAITEHLRTI